jgi:hypothetical protein
MTDFPKLSPEEKDRVLREFKAHSEQGFLDPVLVFNPEGFTFPIAYYRGRQRNSPIPEFRVYAQQYLTLFAIVLIFHRQYLAAKEAVLECRLEIAGESLDMVLTAEASLPPASSSSGEPLNRIGTAFSVALKQLFPTVEEVFWDREMLTGNPKLWTNFPGQMTANGFLKTSHQPFFGSTARMEVPCPSDEQYRRSVALLNFIVGEPAAEF